MIVRRSGDAGSASGIFLRLRAQTGHELCTGHVKAALPEPRQKQTIAAIDFQKGFAPARPGRQTVLQKICLQIEGKTAG